jgi:hypothetical protein
LVASHGETAMFHVGIRLTEAEQKADAKLMQEKAGSTLAPRLSPSAGGGA